MVLQTIAFIVFFLSFAVVQSGKLVFNEGYFIVEWTLSEDKQSIHFKAFATDVIGWIGIGWSLIDRTSGDLVIAEVDAYNKSKLNVGDFWGYRQGLPDKDLQQNLDNAFGSRNAPERTATFEFDRQLNSPDEDQDYDIPLDGIYIMWAYSDGETAAVSHHHRDYSRQKVVFGDSVLGDSSNRIQGTLLVFTGLLSLLVVKAFLII